MLYHKEEVMLYPNKTKQLPEINLVQVKKWLCSETRDEAFLYNITDTSRRTV
jgi:hypothetical protein